ncbi:hypothetical protein GCM10011322_22030 [Salinarimonas ramus]|uniref:Uncharacterized protein n=2 Tax=Salinarimonas ramus TaxID=690164 RepID=A0A917Q864_9HYPH|nr:hypothetical protein GCM10011322_22030 [Salinarimonas ramus]
MVAKADKTARMRARSIAISASLLELKTLSAEIRSNAHAFRENLDRVAGSDALSSMRHLLNTIR